MNRSLGEADQFDPMQLFCAVARWIKLQTRIAVVGNGNIEVGNKTAIRRLRQSPENLAKPEGSESRQDFPEPKRPRVSGAMTQQGGDMGGVNQSALQKFVQLVGYRDPNARSEPWVRPHPAPAKR